MQTLNQAWKETLNQFSIILLPNAQIMLMYFYNFTFAGDFKAHTLWKFYNSR